jgi:hypothetical protein
MKFACDFFNTLTGERRTIVVAITHEQRWDSIVQCPGAMPNPLAKMHALTNAMKMAAPGFVPLPSEVHLMH